MIDVTLVLNAGSSSIKFALYSCAGNNEKPVLHGKISSIGRAPDFAVNADVDIDLSEDELQNIPEQWTHEELISHLLQWLERHAGIWNIVAAGHRVVHGGKDFDRPVVIDATVLKQLQSLVSLAPMHQPHNLAGIASVQNWKPSLLQVACFDTAFHRSQPRLAQLFALPRELSDDGILRYGFHGLSYQYIASQLNANLGQELQGRVIVAHLGNGASMCAMKHGQSVASSMGFTALHGLMMGKRCGSIDAGVVLHMLQQLNMSTDEVQDLLYNKSGLLGISGISNNMQVLEQSKDPNAREAIELFCYIAAGEITRLATDLQGLDAIVFTAGIGVNSSLTRTLICDRLRWLGVAIDTNANENDAKTISSDSSTIVIQVIPTDEESVVASAVHAHLADQN